MAQIPYVSRLAATISRREQAVAGPRFTIVMLVCMAWFLGGLFLDGWAHHHGKVDQSFFTPWHAAFYSGFAAVVGGLAGIMTLNRWRGYPRYRAIPAGYEGALTGSIIFAFGGVFDLIWHTLFGIEENVEALLSPSHLLLIYGLLFVMSSPMRASWRSTTPATHTGFVTQLPLALSATFTLSVLTFITSYLHPYTDLWPARWRADEGTQIMGMGGILLQTALLMGLVLMLLRHWRPAFGTLTVILGVNAALMSVLQDHVIVIAVAGITGLAADLLVMVLRPSAERPGAFRLFAIIVPLILYTCYLGALKLTTGLTWSSHLIGGAPVIAATVGLGLSLLVLPPERQVAPRSVPSGD